MYEARNRLTRHVLPVCPAGELDDFAFYDPDARAEHRAPTPGDLRLEVRERASGWTPLRRQIEYLLESADRAAENENRRIGLDEGAVPLLVHVHGGRNSPTKAARLADDVLTAMLSTWDDLDPEARRKLWLYPIFVQWHSGDFSTASFRQTGLRQGRDLSGVWGAASFPFILVHDLTRGLVRLPRSLLYQYVRDASVAVKVGFDVESSPTRRDSSEVAEAMRPPEGAWESLAGSAAGQSTGALRYHVQAATYDRAVWQHVVRFLLYFPTQVVLKIPTQVFIEGLGQGAWDVMRRRASHLVWLPKTYEQDRTGQSAEAIRAELANAQPNGALPVLFRSMAEREKIYDLTLVAHSMGAMALNDCLDELSDVIDESEVPVEPEVAESVQVIALPDREVVESGRKSRVEVRRIIYMAPACSVIHAAESLVPFLEKHEDVDFYFLALHPVAEADEINLGDLVPRGSLLEWIDTYYTNPANHSERVFGKWSNALLALALFEPVRDRVHFKAFDVAGRSTPQKHGEFNQIPFWLPATYWVEGADEDLFGELVGRMTLGPPEAARALREALEPARAFRSDWLESECGEFLEECERTGRPVPIW